MYPSVLTEARKTNLDGRAQVSGGNGKSPSGAPLLAAALNAFTGSVAIIDANGVIVAVNDGWRRYADENGMRWSRHGIGHNYLAALNDASRWDESIIGIAQGIRDVLCGSVDSLAVEYAFQGPGARYFVQQVAAFDFAGARHAIVSHEDITLQKLEDANLRAAKEAAETRWREEELRRIAAEDRLRIAEAVSELLAIASSGVQLEDALQAMVERVGETLASQAAAIYCAKERWDRLVPVAVYGNLRSTGRNGTNPIEPSILAQALKDECLGVGDVWQHDANSPADSPGLAGQAHHRALLIAPVQLKTGLYGYLGAFYSEPRVFDQADLDVGHLFAKQITLALENAELRRDAERVAIANERSRLARELHDAVTQTLFSASVVAEALPRVWEHDPARGRQALEELRLWTRGALAEMRALLMELRPAALIEKPLPDLIRQLSEAAATRMLIPVVCDITAQAEPPSEVKLALYRMVQEALNNVIKHSRASHVEIRYLALPQRVQVSIIDDGRGFESDRRPQGQLGMTIMRERARHIGAKLTTRTAPGVGTEVCVDWRQRGRKDLYE